jgi:hypothetical protein
VTKPFKARTQARFPTGRVCEWCRKSKGVTFFAVERGDRMVSVAAHSTCISKLRKRQREIDACLKQP